MSRTISTLAAVAFVAGPLVGCRDDVREATGVERYEERAPSVPATQPPAMNPGTANEEDEIMASWASRRDALAEEMSERKERFDEQLDELEERIADDVTESVTQTRAWIEVKLEALEEAISDLSDMDSGDLELYGEELRATAEEIAQRLESFGEQLESSMPGSDPDMEPIPTPPTHARP